MPCSYWNAFSAWIQCHMSGRTDLVGVTKKLIKACEMLVLFTTQIPQTNRS